MRKAALVVGILLLTAMPAAAESLGVWQYVPPKGWPVKADKTAVAYTKIVNPTFCMIALYVPRVPQADLEHDLAKEWAEVVEARFTTSKVTKQPARTTKQKLTSQTMGATLADANGSYLGQLIVVREETSTGSVMVLSNDEKTFTTCLPTALAVVDSITAAKALPATAPATPAPTGLVAKWGAGVSSTDRTSGLSYGSIVSQYELRADGTYTFHQETWRGHFSKPEWYIVDESGTYSADGTKLTLSPKTSKGVLKNAEGKVLQTAQPPIEKVTYEWQMHYFSGINDTQLVLTPPSATARDGALSNSVAFPKSYLYSRTYRPQWRF